ncbi:MAG: hypothetical protein DMF86_25730, partial [Acidobacteria bacterium]
RGERADGPTGRDEARHYHQVERGHGAFARTFEFAEKIESDGVSADLKDGVLTIVLPKQPAPPARRTASYASERAAIRLTRAPRVFGAFSCSASCDVSAEI